MIERRSTMPYTGKSRSTARGAVIRSAVTLSVLLASGAGGFMAGGVQALPSNAPAAAPAAQTTERITTLRIYGETNVCTSCNEGDGNRPVAAGSNTALDPNTGNVPEDPPYTDPAGPFDPLSPEAPEHDYVTWNPAWISEQLGDRRLREMWPGLDGIDEVSRGANIRMGGLNGSEKVWLRHWYEPTRLDKDLNADDCLTDNNDNGQPDASVNPTPSNVDEWYPAIMTELTYMLLDNDIPEAVPAPRDLDDSAPRPACGRAGGTRMVFPVGTDLDALDPTGDLEGHGLTSLDVDFDGRNDVVNVASEASLAADLGVNLDFDGDGALERISEDGVPLSCDDLVVLHTDAVSLARGDTLQFLDHYIKIQSVADSSAVLQVWYNGDLLPRSVQVRSIGIGAAALAADVGPLQIIQPGGGNVGTVPIGPWFVYLQDADVRDGTVTVIVGRALGAPCASMEAAPNVPNRSSGGPWFLKRMYVDGHEYNVVAIQTCSPDEIQYLTLRAPLPKVDVTIEQHSVRLQGYGLNDPLALPPPFNHEHTILEDVVAFEAFEPVEIEPGDEPIDRPQILYMGGPIGPVAPVLHEDDPLTYTGRDPDHPVGPYQDYLASHWFYVDETVNRSFLGQLREKYGAIDNDVTSPPGGLAASQGFFYNEQIFTRPWNFTEFVLPNLPDPPIDAATGEPPWDPDNYYLTSGWINPTARWRVWEMPDAGVPATIPPFPPDLAINNDRFDTSTDQYGAPRRASIEFDPDQSGKVILDRDGTRLFGGFPIDDWLDDLRICSDASDRPSIVLGAGDIDIVADAAGLPVEVLPYTDPFAPFNPQHPDAPRTDSLTFNPAYMDEFRNSGEPLRSLYRQLSNNGANAREKVYHRLWYQPDYVTKIRNPNDCDRDLTFLAMMQEFTYLLMDTTDNPVALPPGVSRLVFPIGTGASELPMPRRGGTLPAGGAFGYGLTTFDADFDGADEAVTIHTEQTLQSFIDTQWQSNRPMIPGIPVLPLAGPILDFDGDGAVDDLDEDCTSLNGNELVVFAIESIVLDLDPNTTESGAAMFLDHLVTLENVTPGSRAQFRFYFTGGNPTNARPEVIGGLRSLDIGDSAIADRFQDRVTIVRPGQQNPGTDGAWFVFLEDVATDAERVTITVGRALGATHSAIDDGAGNHDLTPGDPWYLKRFYVDGHEYNVVALMTQTTPGADPLDGAVCNENFAFITIRTPVPKGNFFNPQDSLFQQGYFLDGLPAQMSVMPPFNVDHTIAVDIERQNPKDFANLGAFDKCVGDLAAAGPLAETIVEEEREPRFGTELRETLSEGDGDGQATRDGWRTHQTIVTPWDFTDVNVPEGQQYLLTLNWRSTVGQLAFYGCTRQAPGPFDDDNLPGLSHPDIAIAAQGWRDGIIPFPNQLDPPQTVPELDEGVDAIQPYYDAACPLGETVRVKVFYDPALDDDIFVNDRDVDLPISFADLSIEKRASTERPAAGSELIYTLTVQNDGPDDATGVLVTDILPPGVTYVGDTDACVQGPPGTLTCTVGDLAAGASTSFALIVLLDPALAEGTELLNVAAVGSPSTIDPDPSNNEDEATVVVAGAADLSITKGASDVTPLAGQQLVYLFSVNNAGPSVADDVVVVDTLPAGVTFVSSTGGCVQGPIGTLTCSLGDIAAGASRNFGITVMVDGGVPPGTVLLNVATVDAATDDPDPSDNTDDAAVIVTAEADLSVDKTASSASVVAGQTVTFTIQVTNNGPSNVGSVTVVDTLPAGLTYVSSTAACVQAPAGTLTCTLGALAAGASSSFQVVAMVGAGVPAGTQLTNVVVVDSPGIDDPDPSDDDDSTTVTVVAAADLAIDKRAPGAVVAGDPLVFTIEVTNDGPSTATGVVVTDVLPAGVTFVSSSIGCVQGPVGTLTCSLGTIAPGGVVTFTITTTVSGALAPGTDLVNTATVNSPVADPDPSNDQDQTTTTVALRTQADISVIKRAPSTVQPGGGITYLLQVTNGGPATAVDVELVDTLPAGVTFVTASPGCTNTPPGSQTVRCDLGDLAPGAFRNILITGQVGAGVALGTVLTNTAVVTSTTPDPDAGDNSDSASTTVTSGGGGGGGGSVDLSVDKTAAATVAPGATLIYTIRVRNLSVANSATDVVVSDLLPDGVTYVSDDSPNGCDPSVGDPSTRICSLGTLAPGADITFHITVAVDPGADDGDVLMNMVAVTADQPDTNPANNQDAVVTTVDDDGGTGGPSADLAISKVASQPTVMAGEMLVYTITVQNLGPSLVPQVIVTDTLPVGITYLSDTSAPGGVSGCTQGPPLRLVCPLGMLASGGTRTFAIMVQVDAGVAPGSVLVNTAVVGQPGASPLALDVDGSAVASPMQEPIPDPNLGNNTATATVNVATQADLALEKDTLNLNPAAGSVFAFELRIKNAGPSDALGVALTDVLPAGLTYVSATAPCDTTGLPELSCALGTITAGATRIVTLTVQVGAGVSPGTTLTNEAEVASPTPDPDLSDNEDDASVIVADGTGMGADLLITKNASDTTPTPGEVVTFTIRVINNGPETAQSVVVTDTLPAGLTYLSNSDSCSTAALPTVVCTLNQIASGVAIEFELIAQVGAGVPGGTTITNVASVGSTTEDPNPGNNEAARSLLVTVPANSADLVVRKTASSLTVTAGELVTFTIRITNTGPADAVGVTLTDVLPAGLAYVSDSAACNTAALPTLTCALGTIPDDTARTITLVAMVSPSLSTNAQLTNTASATATSPPDPDPSDNSSSATVLVQRRSDLKVTKTVAPNPVTAGAQAVFTIQVDNLGPSDAGPVTVTDVLPAGLTHVSNTGSCNTASLPTITCNVGTVAAGGFTSVQITVQVAVGAAGMIPNTATVSSPSVDPVPGNNSSTAIVNVTAGPTADLRIVKGTFDVDPAPGEQVTYNVQVINDGPNAAAEVVVADTLPANVTYVSNTGGCSIANLPTLSCALGAMASGGQASFNIVVTVNAGVPNGTQVVNTATVSASTADPDPSDNSDGAQFIVTILPGAPTNAACQVIGGTQIRISWLDGSTFENEFLLEVSIDGSPFVPLDVVGSTTQGATGASYMYMTAPLPSSTSYQFRVLARNTITGQTSSYSNLTSICTTASQSGNDTGCYKGKIDLQGRSDHAGVLIYMDKMPVAVTDANGNYQFCGVPHGKHKIKARAACYLDAYSGTNLQPSRTLVMPYTALPGGDVNNNGRVDLYDLVKVGAAYRTTPPSDPAADCTADHAVNLFDLVMVGSNFGRVGPVPFGFDPFGLGTPPAGDSGPLDVPAATLEAVADRLAEVFGDRLGRRIGPSPAAGPGSSASGALRPSDPAGTPLGLRVVAQSEDEVTVEVSARGVRGLYGADFQLGYDTAQVEVIDSLVGPGVQVEPGEAFQTGVGLVAENRADAEGGTVDFAATRLDPAPPLDGDVVLATIRFRKRVGQPAGAWQLTEALLLDKEANDLPVRLEGTDIVGTLDWTRGEFVIALPFLMREAEMPAQP